MADYTHEYSNFPDSLITLSNFKDMTDAAATVMGKIQSLQLQGKIGEAAKIIRENSDLLSGRVVDTEWFNMIIEEQRNAEIYAKQQGQYVYDCSSEPSCSTEDIWIGG